MAAFSNKLNFEACRGPIAAPEITSAFQGERQTKTVHKDVKTSAKRARSDRPTITGFRYFQVLLAFSQIAKKNYAILIIIIKIQNDIA